MVYGYHASSGEFRKRTRVSDTTYLNHPERISIGDNVFVWHYSILDGIGGLEIGEGSQIGAWVSEEQSSPIPDRKYLEDREADFLEKFPPGTRVPLPDFWGGFRLMPTVIEYWQGRPSRLHDPPQPAPPVQPWRSWEWV